MKIIPSSIIPIAVIASSLLFGFTPCASAQTITPLTGGDSNDGMDLTGLNVLYAGNFGENPTDQVIQGATFIAMPLNGVPVTFYNGEVAIQGANRTDPGFSPVGWGTTDNDVAMINLNSKIAYGSLMEIAYNVVAGTQYTLFSIISPGSVGGRPSDVLFYEGDLTVTPLLLADNLFVAANNATSVSYTYTASFTGVNTLVVAGSDFAGDPTGNGDQNAVSTGFAIATPVPEPSVISLVMVALVGMLFFWRRRRGLEA